MGKEGVEDHHREEERVKRIDQKMTGARAHLNGERCGI
jgi:hypothetical protein